MATIKQIADELGIPKQRVAKWVRNHFDTASLTTMKTRGSSGAYDLTDEQVYEVKQHFISMYEAGAEGFEAVPDGSGCGSEPAPEPVREPTSTSMLVDVLMDQIEDMKQERRELRLEIAKLNERLDARDDEVRARDAEIRELRKRLDLPWWRRLIGR